MPETEITGLELREAVAKEVVGMRGPMSRGNFGDLYRDGEGSPDEREVPAYEAKIEAAWEIVRAMGAKGWVWRGKTSHGRIRWTFREKWDGDPKKTPREFTAKDVTTPYAICRAALAAVRAEPKCP